MPYRRNVFEWLDLTREPSWNGPRPSRLQSLVAWFKRAFLVLCIVWFLVRLCVALVHDINEQAKHGDGGFFQDSQ